MDAILRRLWLVLLLLAFAPAAHGTIAFVSASSTACTANAASTTCTLAGSTTTGNTVIVMVAIRTTTSTVSSVTDSGTSTYTVCPNGTLNNGTNVRVECWRTAVGGAQASTTLTVTLGASSKFVMSVEEYSGVGAFGSVKTQTGSAANPSISQTLLDANNFTVAGFAGQGSGTFTAGTGNLRANAVTSGGSASTNVGGAACDNTSASGGLVTCSVTNTDTIWAEVAIELRALAPGTPTFIQWIQHPLQSNTSSTSWKFRAPNPSPGGNLLIVECTWSTSASAANPTISDDKSNTWNTAVSTNDATNTQAVIILYAMNSIANTSQVTLSWSVATSNHACWMQEVKNMAIAGALDVTATGNPSATTSIATGSMTTTMNNDLLIQVAMQDATNAKQTFTAGSGWTLRGADGWSDIAVQAQVQSSAGAITPTMTSSASGTWITAAASFKPGSTGTALGSGIRVRGIEIITTPQFGTLSASMTSQFPTFGGSLFAFVWNDPDVTNPPTSITSSPSNTFTNVSCAIAVATSTTELRWTYVVNPTSASTMTITVAAASAYVNGPIWALYEIQGADTSAPFDTCANASGNLAATSGTVTGPNLTTANANELVVGFIQESGDTVTSVPSPTGAHMDNFDDGVYGLFTGDQDGGYMNFLAATAGAVQVNWTYSAYESPATNVGNWASQAVAFKAPAGGGAAPSNLPLMGCCEAAHLKTSQPHQALENGP